MQNLLRHRLRENSTFNSNYFWEDYPGELPLTATKEKPNQLLIQFMKSVLNDNARHYPTDVFEHVREVSENLGGYNMLDVAFNTEGAKRHGALKSKTGMRLQKDLKAFLSQWRNQPDQALTQDSNHTAQTPSSRSPELSEGTQNAHKQLKSRVNQLRNEGHKTNEDRENRPNNTS
ncbi:MAG: hypothetical protein P1U61_06730 [Legionellaceae bacterium]|nr:hypothetical protein [Legionellaceae bacterium]